MKSFWRKESNYLNIMRSKLHAFTMIELLLALVISSLVIYAAVVVYQYSTKELERMNRAVDNMSDKQELIYSIHRDVEASTRFARLSNGIKLYGRIDTVDYRFIENRTIRSSSGSEFLFDWSPEMVEIIEDSVFFAPNNLILRGQNMKVSMKFDFSAEEQYKMMKID